ncbi:hypothetical protein [Thermomonospora sp. CIF 1]|uniref:hypothetical protein n=1 Tax=Thermomonospora sp. CIF 1 TaxID=1916083 RepID=UPI000AEFF24D|nr:hypothetical protein [Thermomonospora sp. CIF 1]PKK14527.1 MAG: hypothetical protein BUE48_009825 [Thermomonospora sp. CIF 1]
MEELIIPCRFNGPPDSGHGGYVAGRLAAGWGPQAVGEGVTVILRSPPPLETPLRVRGDGEWLRLYHGEQPVAEARPGRIETPPIPAVPYEKALAAADGYRGAGNDTPYGMCFACGPRRPDGLRLAPGPVAEDTVAAAWIPDESLPFGPELVWAALDCPGGWTTDLMARPALLGTMTARVTGLPAAGERCVAMGRLLRREGRKFFTATALYGEDGRLLGQADQIWVELTPR